MRRALPVSLVALLVGAALSACAPRPSTPQSGSNSAARPWADSAASGPEAEIYRAWTHHLLAKFGQYATNSEATADDWLPAEREEWPAYELASLYLPSGATPEVLSIAAEPGTDGVYRVVTLFHAADSLNAMRSALIRVTVFAERSGGRWRFGNALPRLTHEWRREIVGPITYVMEPNYPFDRARATRAVTFIDSLATALAVPRLDHVTYYLTPSEDEFCRIIGLETDKKFGPVGGLGQPINHQLFSGIPSQGEEYRHELAHMVLLPLYMGHPTTYFVSEGVPTWVGGTTGMDFPTSARALADSLVRHPEVTLDTLLARQGPVAEFYPAGAVFVDMAYRAGGTEAVKALFDAGPGPEQLRRAAERLLKRPWPAIAADWKTEVLSFRSAPTPNR